jgi:hypothetical protein
MKKFTARNENLSPLTRSKGGFIGLIDGKADIWVKPAPTPPDSYFQI